MRPEARQPMPCPFARSETAPREPAERVSDSASPELRRTRGNGCHRAYRWSSWKILSSNHTKQVADLSERLGQNSRNSHLPPSSDPPGSAGNRTSKLHTSD